MPNSVIVATLVRILARHGLDFIFGSFPPDEGSALIGIEMKFSAAVVDL